MTKTARLMEALAERANKPSCSGQNALLQWIKRHPVHLLPARQLLRWVYSSPARTINCRNRINHQIINELPRRSFSRTVIAATSILKATAILLFSHIEALAGEND